MGRNTLLPMIFSKRKTPKLEVFLRTCCYSNVSAHKLRLPHFSHQKCMKNLIDTIDLAQANLTVLFDTHYQTQYGGGEIAFLQRQLEKKKGQLTLIEIDAGSEAKSFLMQLEHVMEKNLLDETLVYFIEDDYLHLPFWTRVLQEGLGIEGVDYVTLYDHRDKYTDVQYKGMASEVFVTDSCHWRTTISTTNTYAMKMERLKGDLTIHRTYSEERKITSDHEKFLKLREKGATLISSIPGFSTHVEKKFASPVRDWTFS